MRKVIMDNGVQDWDFGSAQYVKAVVKNVEEYLTKQGKSLPAQAKYPLLNGYCPDIDISDKLGSDNASYYQSLIEILRWVVELGHIDICVEVSMLSSYLSLPSKGHLDQPFHIIEYMKKNHNT